MRINKRLISVCLVLMLIFSMFIIPNNSYAIGEQWVAVNTASTTKTPVVTTTKLQTGQYKLNVSFSGFYSATNQVGSETFSMVSIPDCVSKEKPGNPAIPIKTVMIEIPNNSTPTVSLGTVTNKTLTGTYNVFPQQNLASDEIGAPEPTFVKNATTYASTTLFPSNVLYSYSVLNLRNHRILKIDIAPLRVVPSTKKVTFAQSVDINISYSTLVTAADNNSAVPNSSKSFDDVMANGFLKLDGMYPAPVDSSGSTTLEKYMILLDDQFIGNTKLNEFIEWKKKKGYDVVVVKTSQVNSNGAPTNTELVNYMRALPGSDYPTYLLIIGDQTDANGVAGKYFRTSYGGYTDLDITCRDSTDLLPDLFCGRIPAYNSAELTTMLTKVLAMDKKPPTGRGISNMYDKILVAGQIQDADHNNVADRLFCETADGVATYFEQNPGGYTYGVTRAVVNPQNVTADCLWQQTYPILWKGATGDAAKIGTRVFNTFTTVADARTKITNSINSGVAIVQHRDHGEHLGWGDPSYKSVDVNALTNGIKTPLVLSINCLTGGYHISDSFVRAWLKNNNNGAYGVVGAIDVSYSGPNDWLTHGMYMAFLPDYRTFHNNSTNPNWSGDLPAPTTTGLTEGKAKRLGQMLNFAKMYMYANTSSYSDTTLKLFHLFGDPEAAVQLHFPNTQNVSCLDNILIGTSNFTVTTGEADSRVSLYGSSQEGNYTDIRMCGTTDSTGKVTFNVSPYTTKKGGFYLTVTKPGAMPYQKIIAISSLNFTSATGVASGGWTTSVVATDLNKDGIVDLAYTDHDTDTIMVQTGTASGTYNSRVTFPAGSDPSHMTYGDFNKDGNVDLVFGAFSGSSGVLSIITGKGNGTFNPKVDFPLGGCPQDIATGDFNKDGNLDVAIGDNNGSSDSIAVYLGKGNGTFGTKTDYYMGTITSGIAIADFNKDGILDMAVSGVSNAGNPDAISVFIGKGNGTFNAKVNYTSGKWPRTIVTADFNKDGKLDLAFCNSGDNTISVMEGNGNCTFQTKVDYPAEYSPQDMVSADFDRDGSLDLALCEYGGNKVAIYTGKGNGTFYSKVSYVTGSSPNNLVIADINRDGKKDLVVHNFTVDNISFLKNNNP